MIDAGQIQEIASNSTGYISLGANALILALQYKLKSDLSELKVYMHERFVAKTTIREMLRRIRREKDYR